MRAVHSTVVGRRAVRLCRANDGASLRRLPGLQLDASPVASPTEPATQSSDVGMLGGHVLATRGSRSCAACSWGYQPTQGPQHCLRQVRSGETRERRLPLLGTATAYPARCQAKQNAAIRQGFLDSPCLSGLEDLFLAMSSAHDHRCIEHANS